MKIEVVLSNTNTEISIGDYDETEIVEISEDFTDNETAEYLHEKYGKDGWLAYNFID